MTERYLWQWTHSDLDGAGCAVVAAHLFPHHRRDVRYCNYNGPNNINAEITSFLDGVEEKGLPEGEHEVFITDIAPSPEICARLDAFKEIFHRVAVFDHHETTFETSKKFDWFSHSENALCATRMLYEHACVPDETLRTFVYAVDAWDLWLLASKYRERGERLDLLYKLLGFREFLSHFRAAPDADLSTWLKNLAEILESRRDRFVSEVIRRQGESVYTDGQGRKYGVLIGTGEYTSELGNDYLDAHPEADYVAILLPGIDVVSLRAREGGFDVAKLAEKFTGGGGHQAAAGFSPVGSMHDFLSEYVRILIDGAE